MDSDVRFPLLECLLIPSNLVTFLCRGLDFSFCCLLVALPSLFLGSLTYLLLFLENSVTEWLSLECALGGVYLSDDLNDSSFTSEFYFILEVMQLIKFKLFYFIFYNIYCLWWGFGKFIALVPKVF